mmetsp:Transcript_656/g.1506  ORF Transcript_656/g.1506 Transcript_656/m.1506 type:complete len:126 (+) Transcript_656:1-378(+)
MCPRQFLHICCKLKLDEWRLFLDLLTLLESRSENSVPNHLLFYPHDTYFYGTNKRNQSFAVFSSCYFCGTNKRNLLVCHYQNAMIFVLRIMPIVCCNLQYNISTPMIGLSHGLISLVKRGAVPTK